MSRLYRLLALLALAAFTAPTAKAQTYYWDGTSSTVNGLSSSTTGTIWSTTAGNWDNGTAEVLWTTAHSAVFGGTASTVTIGSGGVSIGSGSQFMRFDATGYTIAAGANGLNFGTSNTDNITLFANNTGAATATSFTGTVGGSGNVIFSSQNGGVANANTMTFSGTMSGGWSGTTTVNAGMQLISDSTGGANQVLNSTSAININGGTILFRRNGSTNTNLISDSAPITVNGGGMLAQQNLDSGNTNAIETVGAVTVNSGQFVFHITNGGSSGSTIRFNGLTLGSTSTVTFNGAAATSNIWVNLNGGSAPANTSANAIIGPYATFGVSPGSGTLTSSPTDYAVYSGGNGTLAARGIAASPQSTWSPTTASTSNYTMSALASATLSATRNINTVRSLNNSVTVTANVADIALASHSLSVGDVVTFSAATMPTGLTAGTPYYVAAVGSGTIQVSTSSTLTPIITPTTAGTTVVAAGAILLSSGKNLGTTGILNGSATTLNILQSGGAGVVTLPATGAGNLYVTTGAGAITINAPIQDFDVSSPLKLVKSGTGGTLTLSGTNTYTGGTVINAGSITYTSDANLGTSGSRNVTFGGTGTLTGFNGSSLGILTVNQGAVATISGNGITFATTTGSGKVNIAGAQSQTVNLGDASTLTGDISLGYAFNNVSIGTPTLTFTKLNDATGSSLQIFRNGGGTDGGQVGQIALIGDLSPLSLNNRQIQLLPRTTSNQDLTDHVLYNNNATATNKWVIGTSLLNLLDRNLTSFTLGGSNAGDNAFNGTIGDSTKVAGVSLIVQKTGAGKWILGGANTYTGGLIISQGTLTVATLNEVGTAGPLGMNNTLQLGGTAVRLKTNIGSISGGGANSGILEYTGGTVTSSRSFFIGDSTAGDTGAGTILNNGTGAITFSAATFNPTQTGITGTRTLTVGGINTGNNEVVGIIQDNALTGKVSFAKSGIGTWILSGSNAMTGTNTLSGGGTLVLNYGTNNNAKLASGALTVTGGGNLILRAGSSFAETVASTSFTAGGGNLSITQDTSGTNTINLNGLTRAASNGSTLSLEADSIATSDLTNNTGGILGGWVTVGSNWAKNSTNLADGAIVGLTAGEYTAMPTTGGTGTVNYQLTGAALLSGAVTGNTLRISNSADDQVLDLGSNRNLSVSAVGPTGGLLYAGGNNNNYRITGTGTSRLQAQNANQELIINVYTGTLTVEVPVESSASNSNGVLTKTGTGTLVLKAASDYAAPTYVNQGTLQLASLGTLGAVSTGTNGTFVFNGAALELTNGIAVGGEALTITGTGVSNAGALRNITSSTSSFAGAITIGAGGARINSDSSGALTLTGGVVTSILNNVTFGGAGNTTVSTAAISGAGGLVKDGAGTTTLSFANTYTGATQVNNGTLAIGVANAIPAVSPLTLNTGTFDLNGLSQGTATVNGVGNLSLAATSTLSFGTTGTANIVRFAGLGTHTASTVLQVTNYEAADRLYFAGAVADFIAAYSQSEVSFNGTLGYSTNDFTTYYEVAPGAVPEPTAMLGIAAVGFGVFVRRRRATAAV